MLKCAVYESNGSIVFFSVSVRAHMRRLNMENGWVNVAYMQRKNRIWCQVTTKLVNEHLVGLVFFGMFHLMCRGRDASRAIHLFTIEKYHFLYLFTLARGLHETTFRFVFFIKKTVIALNNSEIQFLRIFKFMFNRIQLQPLHSRSIIHRFSKRRWKKPEVCRSLIFVCDLVRSFRGW